MRVGIWEIVFLVALLGVVAVPAYIIGKRRSLARPAVAFVPAVGPVIVLLEAAQLSGWLVLVILVPYAGVVALAILLAVSIPRAHGRSGWWTLPFVMPIVNLGAYWVYAFTLEPGESEGVATSANV